MAWASTHILFAMQQEIVDETDIFEDVNTGLRRGGPRVDVANFLAMFEHKLNHLQACHASCSHKQYSAFLKALDGKERM